MTHGVQPGGEGAASSGGATPERLVEGRFVDLARHAWDFQRDPIRFFTAIRDAYGPTFYVCYLRDPQGNKIALFSSNPADPGRDG